MASAARSADTSARCRPSPLDRVHKAGGVANQHVAVAGRPAHAVEQRQVGSDFVGARCVDEAAGGSARDDASSTTAAGRLSVKLAPQARPRPSPGRG